MTKVEIKRMGELKAIIDKATDELETLKEKARKEANGEAKSYLDGSITVVVRKPAAGYEQFDTKMFATKAPETYAKMFAKYHKTVSPKKARVEVFIAD